MSIQIDDSLRVGQQKNLDAKYDNDGQKWTSVSQAMSGIPLGERSHGQQILINDVVYWWHPSNPLTDSPVIKDNPNVTVDDGLVSGGEIDISAFASGNITVDTASWILTVSGVQQVYTTTSPTLFTGISLSTAGNQRYVAFYGTDLNTIIKVEGTQSPAAVMPSTPTDTVLLGYVLVTDAIAEPPVVDLTGYAKLNEDNTFTGDNEFKKTPTINGVNVATVNDVPDIPIASVTEINTGTNNTSAASPLGLQGSKYLDRFFAKISATTTGTNTSYIASLTPALTAYVENQLVILTFNVNSGGTPTINIDGLGDRNLRRINGVSIQPNDLTAGVKYLFIYDGTSFVLTTPSLAEVIRNQTASQTANFYITGTGRSDTGIGLGIAANAAAFETIAAATAAKAQLLLTQGAVDYTGTINGIFWNKGGEIKFIDNSIVNRIIKADNNEIFKSTGNYFLLANQDGGVSASVEAVQLWVTDTDVITAINGATWVNDKATITPASSKVMYRGELYFKSSTNTLYIAVDNNVVLRFTAGTGFESAFSSSSQTIVAATPTVLSLSGSTMTANGGLDLINESTSTINAQLNDVIVVDIAAPFTTPAGTNNYATVIVRVKTTGTVYRAYTHLFVKGAGNQDYLSASWSIPINSDAATNGLEVVIESTADITLPSKFVSVTRVHKAI